MRVLLKLILILSVLLAVIYASSPLWLGSIVARQLPPDWQLEELESQYPGFSALKIKTLKLRGVNSNSGLALSINQLLLPYSLEQLSADTLAVDVTLEPQAAAKLEDFSIPVLTPSTQLPSVSIAKINIKLKREGEGARLAQLQLSEFTLVASPGGKYNFSSDIKLMETTPVNGFLEGEIANQIVAASLKLVSADGTSPWLRLKFRQQLKTNTSSLQAEFDSGLVDAGWLNASLAYSSKNRLTGLTGKLSVDARFAGESAHLLESLALNTEQMSAITLSSELQVNMGLKVSRTDAGLTAMLLRKANISYHNISGEIPRWITNNIAGLEFPEETMEATVVVGLSTHSKLLLPKDNSRTIKFSGDVDLNIGTTSSSIQLPLTEIEAEINQLLDPDSIIASAAFKLEWRQESSFVYTGADLKLQANTIILTTQGKIQLADSSLNATEPLAFEAQLGDLQASIFTDNETTTLSAEKTLIKAQVSLSTEQLSTTGKATLRNAEIQPMGLFAANTELQWTELKPQASSGQLRTRTTGFSAQIENESWAGFDFDIDYQLVNSSRIKGNGKLILDAGTDIPISFSGNPETANWDVEIKESKIQANQLSKILALAKIDTPAGLKLHQGQLIMRGSLQLTDGIATELNISGKDIGLSFLKTTATGGDFSAKLDYSGALRVNGKLVVKTVNLAAGLDLTEFGADIVLREDGEINFHQLAARLFSGQLKTERLQVIDANTINSTMVFTGLNLQQLLAFADFDGLTGSGKLDINLPIISEAAGAVVKNGTFESTEPGFLSYFQAGVPSSNIGLQALENFQYKSLSGTIEYRADGGYSVVIKLQGSNPDLYNGYPIAFSLNIAGVLPELFNALFISGNFEEAILKQVKSDTPETPDSGTIQ